MSDAVPQQILVVDDDPTARILMQASLQQAGFVVQVAADAQEALQLFHGASFDLVMSDVEMPGMDGFELCARLRAESDVPVPVVMVTGMDDLASIDRAFAVFRSMTSVVAVVARDGTACEAHAVLDAATSADLAEPAAR